MVLIIFCCLPSSYCRCIETESLNENENITEIPHEGISTNSNSYNEEEASSDVVSVETSSLGISPEPEYYQEVSQLNEPQPARKHSWLAYAVLMLVAVLVSGAMAMATDKGGIQFRVLNGRKGPAVRATRAQADRIDRKSTRLNSSHYQQSRMPSSA